MTERIIVDKNKDGKKKFVMPRIILKAGTQVIVSKGIESLADPNNKYGRIKFDKDMKGRVVKYDEGGDFYVVNFKGVPFHLRYDKSSVRSINKLVEEEWQNVYDGF